MPPLHAWPALHALLHAPQFPELLDRSTQEAEHAVSAVGALAQIAEHTPSEQT
jgi:hypothetical protein